MIVRFRMKYSTIDLLYSFVSIVSLFGCIWHLSDVSGIYFAYDTTINVNFEREIMVELPGITICTDVSWTFAKQYADNNTDFLDLLQSTNEESEFEFHDRVWKRLHNLTLSEQLNRATIDSKQFFNSCLIMKPIDFENVVDDDYVQCDQVSPIYQYITYSKKCFSIGLRLNNESVNRFRIDHDTNLRDNGFPLIQIRLNQRYLHDSVLFIHSRTTPFLGFMGGQTNGIHLNNTKYSSYTLSYVKTTTQLLPPPFKTLCRRYETIGYKTLSHCIVSCKANYFVKEFNGWHPDIPANDDYNLNVYYSKIELKENKTLDKFMAERCLNSCSNRQDCHSEYYSMSVIGQFERRQSTQAKNENLHGIYIYLPSGLNTRYEHSPRLHLIEFICYFASVFSLWFGLSIIAISKALINTVHTYRKRREDEMSKKNDLIIDQINLESF
ncbi:hypothetical protein SSS_08620 [Sarcoptes scabiei]|uniref:Degenerin-like protein n=1 Tax=Sarcoptes scabiei TaxID=52283 RepID=A0A132AK08_SARSC|nr:hypothetical protein SSS_08620 [Sarcoptes scabiei]KPM11301.1 degenerin-like protein [Sarcoptes scabiei]